MSKKQGVTAENNLSALYPALAKEYSAKNELPADKIHPNSNRKVLWECSNCGHEWKATVKFRVLGGGCPADSKRMSSRKMSLN